MRDGDVADDGAHAVGFGLGDDLRDRRRSARG